MCSSMLAGKRANESSTSGWKAVERVFICSKGPRGFWVLVDQIPPGVGDWGCDVVEDFGRHCTSP